MLTFLLKDDIIIMMVWSVSVKVARKLPLDVYVRALEANRVPFFGCVFHDMPVYKYNHIIICKYCLRDF